MANAFRASSPSADAIASTFCKPSAAELLDKTCSMNEDTCAKGEGSVIFCVGRSAIDGCNWSKVEQLALQPQPLRSSRRSDAGLTVGRAADSGWRQRVFEELRDTFLQPHRRTRSRVAFVSKQVNVLVRDRVEPRVAVHQSAWEAIMSRPHLQSAMVPVLRIASTERVETRASDSASG